MSSDDHLDVSPSTVATVIDVALTHFATVGYAETKIETISRESGMSKRMIHYHFGDKKGLYYDVLKTAATRLSPATEDMVIDSAVPVEGVRKIIEVLATLHQDHPTEIKLLIAESIFPHGDVRENPAIADFSDLLLHLNKLLILGQDSGVFRPGISAQDLFILITALTVYPVSSSAILFNLTGVDLLTEENRAGQQRLLIDTVLAFLTSNIPNSGDSSYLTVEAPTADNDAADIYGDDLTR